MVLIFGNSYKNKSLKINIETPECRRLKGASRALRGVVDMELHRSGAREYNQTPLHRKYKIYSSIPHF